MPKKSFYGDLLSRGQETRALSSLCFRKSKLYKMRLVHTHPTIFGDYSDSDQWELFVKAMKDDLFKQKEFKFRHPKDSEKEYERHYIGCPANGIALLMVGQFKKEMDFAFVRIVLKSVFYGEPYIVLEKYAQSFRNPDILAKMVESAFNWVLKGQGVIVKLEPWEPNEQVMWLLDYEESYMTEVQKMKKEDLIMIGYEDALERHQKLEAKKKKRQIKKAKSIKDYILFKDKALVMKLLRHHVSKFRLSKKVAMPFRLFMERKRSLTGLTASLMTEMPELKGKISKTRYNHWTDKMVSSYKGDSDYEALEKEIDDLLKD